MAERWITTHRGRCREVDLPDGTIQRYYISPNDVVRGGGTCTVVDSTAGIVDRTSSIARSTATVKTPVFLESLSPSQQVTIGFHAQQDIRREARRMRLATRGTDMLESGGWLFSHPGFLNSVVAATGPGADAEHEPHSMRMGVEHLETARAAHPHLIACGSWHLHPSNGDLVGVAKPSPADRKAWELWRQAEGLSHHIGIIAVDPGNGWTDPKLYAWLTTRDYCEQLALRLL
jgi:hypothetical protein